MQIKFTICVVRVSQINMPAYKSKLRYRYQPLHFLITLLFFNLHLMPPSVIIWSYNFTLPTLMISALKKINFKFLVS